MMKLRAKARIITTTIPVMVLLEVEIGVVIDVVEVVVWLAEGDDVDVEVVEVALVVVVVVLLCVAPPAASVVPVVPAAELTVTAIVFCKESALVGLIANVTVRVPAVAEEDAAIVQDSPAFCPPDMDEGEQPEEILKSLGETVILPNCAVVSPEFCMFKLKVNVEPCCTLVEVGETVAEREGAFFTSNEVLPDSGVHAPEMLTVIDWELALVAVSVVQDTLEPLMPLL